MENPPFVCHLPVIFPWVSTSFGLPQGNHWRGTRQRTEDPGPGPHWPSAQRRPPHELQIWRIEWWPRGMVFGCFCYHLFMVYIGILLYNVTICYYMLLYFNLLYNVTIAGAVFALCLHDMYLGVLKMRCTQIVSNTAVQSRAMSFIDVWKSTCGPSHVILCKCICAVAATVSVHDCSCMDT